MIYNNIYPAKFIARPNRFIAHVELNGVETVCHVKNTGRCKELLLPGAAVYVQKAGNPARKTAYDLISVQKGGRLINMDSQAPNRVFREWVEAGGLGKGIRVRPEFRWGASRMDFLLESDTGRTLVEVKGVTLERGGVVLFPDAPTQRGVKHVRELIRARAGGCGAMIVFIIQMADVAYFTPNDETHPAFGEALREASRSGVELLALDCAVAPDSITAGKAVALRLREESI